MLLMVMSGLALLGCSKSRTLSLSLSLDWKFGIGDQKKKKKDRPTHSNTNTSPTKQTGYQDKIRIPVWVLDHLLSSVMDSSSDRLFNRQRTLHEILGGGFVADVMLWRRKDTTIGILLITLAAWVVFERSSYTLLSLVSSVLLLLITIFFLWSKSAATLNRPPPPLPDLYLSEEMVNEVAAIIRSRVNALFSVSQDIALGKDSNLFFKVAACLGLLSVVGGWTDFLTLGYTSLVIVLTLPALYEKYEDQIDRYVLIGYRELQRLYVELDTKCLSKIKNWDLEKRKLS